MLAQALIISRDEEMNVIFKRALESMGISAHLEERVGNTLRLLAKNKYDVIVVDHDDIGDAPDVLGAVRNGKSNKSAIVFAVLNGQTLTSVAYQTGANFTLEKPLSTDRVTKSLRAAHGLIVAERRRYFRHPVNAPIFLQELSDRSETQGEIINLSEGGLAVSLSSKRLKKEPTLRLRFILPGSTAMVVGTGGVMWSKGDRQIGIRFAQLSRASRRELDEWLNQKWRQLESEIIPPRASGKL